MQFWLNSANSEVQKVFKLRFGPVQKQEKMVFDRFWVVESTILHHIESKNGQKLKFDVERPKVTTLDH